MSQHKFKTVMADGRDVMVTLGWDRPLRGHFALVEQIVADEVEQEVGKVDSSASPDDGEDFDENDGFVYSNLRDPNLIESYGLSASLGYFEKLLKGMGILVPVQIMLAVEQDAINNVGNKLVMYDSDGRVQLRYKESK
jgi:hypothetical protein